MYLFICLYRDMGAARPRVGIYLARSHQCIPLPPLYIIILFNIYVYSNNNYHRRQQRQCVVLLQYAYTVRDPLDQLQLVIVFKLCTAEKKMCSTYILYYIQGDSSQARSLITLMADILF